MAVTAFVFGQHVVGQYSATSARRIDWAGDTVKCALTTNSYTPDQDAHDFFDDVTNEVTGTAYTAGGVALGSKAVSYVSGSNEARLTAANASWTAATISNIRRAVVYKDTGTASTSPLISWVDFGADQTIASGTFTIVWAATGIVAYTVA